MARILAVVGRSCVGKSTLIGRLNEHLDWDVLGIDTERANGGDWSTLSAKIARRRTPATVESIAMPAIYRDALKQQDTTIMLVTCDELERQRRLVQRNETRSTGRNYTRSNTHFRIDTTHGVTVGQLHQIAEMARTRYARRPASIEQSDPPPASISHQARTSTRTPGR